jgi:hypothetical protein
MPSRHMALYVLVDVLLLSICLHAQPAADTRHAAKQKLGRDLLEKILKQADQLSLPQNRITLESAALELLWRSDKQRARALTQSIEQAMTEFRNLESSDDVQRQNRQQFLISQRQQLVQSIAQYDPQLALDFLSNTGAPFAEGDPDQERITTAQLQMSIAGRLAEQDPQRALRMAESSLGSSQEIPPEVANVLSVLQQKDPAGAARLLGSVVSQLRKQDAVAQNSRGNQGMFLALNLLNMAAAAVQEKGKNSNPYPSNLVRQLADTVVADVTSQNFPSYMYQNVESSLSMLEVVAPEQAAAVRERLTQFQDTLDPGTLAWHVFNRTQQTGSTEQLMAVAAQAPPSMQLSMYQQLAWKLAGEGNYVGARQLVEEKVSDPAQRSQMQQVLLRQAALAAGSQENMDLARRLAEQVNPPLERATALIQVAQSCARDDCGKPALEILDEAHAFINEAPQNASRLNAQIQLAQAYARLDPGKSTRLLEPVSEQINRLLSAYALLEGFEQCSQSFEGGELLLNGYLVNTLITQYTSAISFLVSEDFEGAQELADRLQLPEARLMAELQIARAALGVESSGTAAVFRFGSVGVGE